MNNKEVVALYPLMPMKYSPQKRKELRKFEKELLKRKKIKREYDQRRMVLPIKYGRKG